MHRRQDCSMGGRHLRHRPRAWGTCSYLPYKIKSLNQTEPGSRSIRVFGLVNQVRQSFDDLSQLPLNRS
jgi:hypothetical protein